jgi:hypothetical protein
MAEIEKVNPSLKGVLPKDYNRPALDKVMLGELIDLVSGIGMGELSDKAKDILGRVYEYFLGGFAGSERKRGGEFYTPRSVVRVLVEMLEPYAALARPSSAANAHDGFPRSLHRHGHHVAVEIGDDPDRACDNKKDDQDAEREGQNIVRAVGPAAQM